MFDLFINIPPSLDFLKVRPEKKDKSVGPFIFLSEQQHENSSPSDLAVPIVIDGQLEPKILEQGDTPCAAPQTKKRLRLIRRAIYPSFLAAERFSCSQPLPSRPHTLLLHPGGEDSQLVCVYTSSALFFSLLERFRVSYTLYLGPAGAKVRFFKPSVHALFSEISG